MVAIRRTSDDMSETEQCVSDNKPLRYKGVTKWKSAPPHFEIPDVGCPTSAPPGTTEKLQVMIVRESRNEPIFNQYDARWDGDVRPLMWYLRRYETVRVG